VISISTPSLDRKKIALRAILLALTIAAGYAERLIPFDFAVPGVKLGLPNAAVLIGLYLLSFRDGLIIVAFKCALTALLFGSAGSFLFSVCGSVLSFAAMCLAMKILKQKISPVGVSVVGAVFHNAGQLAAAAPLLGTHKIFYYLPVLLVSGVIAGAAVGAIVGAAIKILKSVNI